ncbi:MAG: hypothetical protein KUL82_08245 [Bdellovibrio sp.]|nr:hypothetical protein [Bdellovibrio sp.]
MDENEKPMETSSTTDLSTSVTDSSSIVANPVQEILPPAEFSKLLFLDIGSRKKVINYKHITESHLNEIIGTCDSAANYLAARGYVDTNILYEISTEREEYSGADKNSFVTVFKSSSQVLSLSIEILANYDKRTRPHCRLKFAVGKNDSFANQMVVVGTDSMWVKSTYALFSQLIDDLPNANRFLYHKVTEFLIQIFAVFIVFSISVWSTKYVDASKLPFSTVYIFAAVFLFGSNSWTYISRFLISARDKYFPMNSFKGRRIESMVLTGLVAVCAIVLTWGINNSLDFIKGRLIQEEQKPVSTESSASSQGTDSKKE